MAGDFLRRWSRLKHDAGTKPVEKKDQPPALPPLDKMTPDSDFTAFMQPKVEDALRRAALKKLFSDPRFNIPDPFEAYSGDWTGGEPISAELLATLNQAQTVLFREEEKPKEQERKLEDPKPGKDEPGRQGA